MARGTWVVSTAVVLGALPACGFGGLPPEPTLAPRAPDGTVPDKTRFAGEAASRRLAPASA
jgi:hypothetical protein